MRRFARAATALLVVASACLAVAGCNRDSQNDAQLAQADTLIRAGKYLDALQQTRAALERNDKNPQAHRIAGAAYLELGKVPYAYQHLLRAQVLAPNRPEIRADLARVYLLEGNLTDARDQALMILDADAQNVTGAILLAATPTTSTQIDDALRRLEGLRATSGNNASPRLALASLYERKGDLAKATQQYKDVIASDARSAEAHALLASVYEKGGSTALAAGESKTAGALATSNSTSPLHAAEAYLMYGQRQKAQAVLRTAAAEDSPTSSIALRLLGELALGDSNAVLADETGGRILQKDSADVDGLLQIGRARLIQRKYDEATSYFQRALKADPLLAPTHYYLGTALLLGNHVDEARGELQEALKLTRNYPDALRQFATLNAHAETPRATIADADRMVKLNPRSMEARRVLGEALLGAERPKEADDVFRDAIKRAPDQPEPRYWLGVSLAKQGKNAEARRELEEALRLSPNLGEVMSQLVAIDLSEGRSDSALARINTQLRLFPQSAALYDMLGTVHLARNERDAATTALEKSAQLDPKLVNPRVQLTNLYVTTQKFDLAVAHGEVARKLDPKNVSALLALGVAHQTRGEFALARQAYEEALSADPNSTAAANNLAFLLSETSVDQAEAMRYALTALKLSPRDPNIKDTAGWILYKDRQYNDAISLLRESAQLLPNSPDVQYHYGMAALKTGDTATARRALGVAVQATINYPGKEDARKALSLLK